jgi:hypothetical protein
VALEQNSGIVAALNLGLAHCSGQYIARMDADDVALCDRLESVQCTIQTHRCRRQVRFLEENPGISVLGGAVKIIGDSTENGQVFCPPISVGSLHASLFFSCSVFHPTLMARRQVFEDFKYSSQYPISEDWALWLEVGLLFH